MSEILAIFEKINQVFKSLEKGDEYKMYFSPYSLGYTHEDFLFLKLSTASTDADKARDYYDEAYDFAMIANNIPRNEDGIWKVSSELNDLVFNNYKTLVGELNIILPTIESIVNMYNHPIFKEALQIAGKDNERAVYGTYLKLFQEATAKLDSLRAQPISDPNHIKIELVKSELCEIEKKWNESGYKNSIETDIITILKKEFDKFVKIKEDTSLTLIDPTTTISSRLPFFFTTCVPNNLYDSDKLSWNSITLQKTQISDLVKNASPAYKAIVVGTGLENLELEEIKFELLFVNIVRPWFNENILLSPFWDIKMLNSDSLTIPRYPTELVFVRNINMKLKTGSVKNEEILKLQEKESLQNKSPFKLNYNHSSNLVNLSQVKNSLHLEKKIKLQAQNIKRINPFNLTNRNIFSAISKTKKFFLTFKDKTGASINPINSLLKIDNNVIKCRKRIVDNVLEVYLPVGKQYLIELNDNNYENTPFTFTYDVSEDKLPAITRQFNVVKKEGFRRVFDHKGNFIKYEVSFELEGTNKLLDPTSAEVSLNNIVQPVFRNLDGSMLTLVLKASEKYTIELISDGEYLEESFELSLTAMEKSSTVVKRKFIIKKKPETINETLLMNGEFQLLGIICKNLPKVPNPII